jgi:predicted pyridoxine 5'-phosphate oxidase superfamily flavin-nucleotide-binding protein
MEPNDFYTDAQCKLQTDNDSRKLAKAVVNAIVSEELQAEQINFISTRDFFFLSSVSSKGEPTVSYKGGPVGVVHIISPTKLAFPNYDGNGMFFSMGNISEMNKVGLLFIDLEQNPLRVRVQGDAILSNNPKLLERFPGANMIVEINITSVFYNCARYIHKHTRTETSQYVPNLNGEQPFPSWKRIDGLQDSLHPNDIGKAENEGGTISMDEYNDHVSKGIS